MNIVGRAAVQIFPSFDGLQTRVSAGISAPLARAGQDAGQEAGSRFSAGFMRNLKIGGAFAAAGVGSLIGKSIVSGLDIQAGNAKITAQLDLTGRQSARAGKAAGKLFGQGYGDGIEQIQQAIGFVIRDIDGMRGASERTLTRIGGKVTNVASIFDQDLGGVTRGVSQLMRTGLAKNADEALDVVTKGFQSGADKAGDYLDTLNEYGTQFRKFGLDGKTATGLLSQGLKAGARDSDLDADSIKEFGIRAVDGSKTTSQGFRAIGLNARQMAEQIGKGGGSASKGLDVVLDRLRKVEDPVKRSQIAVKLFGTQAEDLGNALFALDPSKAVSGLGRVEGAADRAGNAFNDNAKSKVSTFFRGLQQGAVDILGRQVIPVIETRFLPLAEDVASVLGDLTGFVVRHNRVFTVLAGVVLAGAAAWKVYKAVQAVSLFWLKLHTVGTIENTVASKVAAAASKTWAAGQWLLNAALTANPIGLVVVAIGALVGGFALAYKKSETFRNVVNGALGKVKAVALAVVDWFRTDFVGFFTTKIPAAFQATKDWVSSKWVAVKELVTRPVKDAKDGIVELWGKVRRAFTDARDWATGTFKTSWAAVKAVVTVPVEAAKDRVGDVFDKVQGIFEGILNWVDGFFDREWRGLHRLMTDPIDAAKTGIGNALHNIRGAFDTAVTVITGIWDGLRNAASEPVEFVVNTVFAGLVRAINKIPGIDLPVPHFAHGGEVPLWAGERGKDSVLAMMMPGEHVWTEEEVQKVGGHGNMKRLRNAIRKGWMGVADLGALPHFAVGGGLSDERVQSAAQFAVAQRGKPYLWGGVGPTGYDCSGFMSAITNVLRGMYPYQRVGATASFPWSGFNSGAGEFTIGSTPNYGGSGIGHMAGSLLNLHVESRGGTGVIVGTGARSAYDSGFSTHAHLGMGGAFDRGGETAGVINMFKDAIGAVKGFAGKIVGWFTELDGMGGWGGLIKNVASAAVNSARSWVNDKIPEPGPFPAFDTGGVARSIGYVPKATIRPERVLSPYQTQLHDRQTVALEAIARRGGGPQPVRLVVDDGREFRGYLEDIADDRVAAAADMAGMRGRAGAGL